MSLGKGCERGAYAMYPVESAAIPSTPLAAIGTRHAPAGLRGPSESKSFGAHEVFSLAMSVADRQAEGGGAMGRMCSIS
jgi:hypothetical protein